MLPFNNRITDDTSLTMFRGTLLYNHIPANNSGHAATQGRVVPASLCRGYTRVSRKLTSRFFAEHFHMITRVCSAVRSVTLFALVNKGLEPQSKPHVRRPCTILIGIFLTVLHVILNVWGGTGTSTSNYPRESIYQLRHYGPECG